MRKNHLEFESCGGREDINVNDRYSEDYIMARAPTAQAFVAGVEVISFVQPHAEPPDDAMPPRQPGQRCFAAMERRAAPSFQQRSCVYRERNAGLVRAGLPSADRFAYHLAIAANTVKAGVSPRSIYRESKDVRLR